ncbi:hypothetical protein ACFFF5_21505 [Lederbergia wuyishanensis]|uniref:Uncharacterized protein n=1 Tax=Lederbergia wuyishanensis TaxID=1347903 RepID=A0ABU0DA87_9BACI|nr:hypothetical protein [Lederbergia wuyishanensis]MCJ8010108.1 hypothetical protein [Lederbergia wuyishanensis]MDQ0345346.1 hypothetical protein [Lederbergia wuyishanensis]
MPDDQIASIVAVVTTKQGNIQGGGAPFFIVEDADALQKVSLSLERILDAAASEIDENTIVIVAR